MRMRDDEKSGRGCQDSTKGGAVQNVIEEIILAGQELVNSLACQDARVQAAGDREEEVGHGDRPRRVALHSLQTGVPEAMLYGWRPEVDQN
jgi:hypothetical protein